MKNEEAAGMGWVFVGLLVSDRRLGSADTVSPPSVSSKSVIAVIHDTLLHYVAFDDIAAIGLFKIILRRKDHQLLDYV